MTRASHRGASRPLAAGVSTSPLPHGYRAVTIPSWVVELYEDLHSHPELSHHEHRTATRVANHLREFGFDVIEGLGGTGVLGQYVKGHDGPVVALRIELDGLPLKENTGLDHASRNEGVMHACGHDLHIAAALAAVEQLSREDWQGRLVIIGQPAEESGTGAQAMLDDGLRHHLPRPDALLAQHVTPYAPVGVMVSSPKQALATCDIFRIQITGSGGHTSIDDPTDCIQIAMSLTRELTQIPASAASAGREVVLSIPHLTAPGHPGVRALTAELIINLRTQHPDDRSHTISALHRVISNHGPSVTSHHSLPHRISAEHITHVPAVENDPRLLGTIATQHRAAGLSHIHVPPGMASDDFAVLADGLDTAAAYWFVGSAPPGQALGSGTAPCHSASYAPHAATLEAAVAAMHCALRATLTKGPGCQPKITSLG